jgi:hypothetical protein
MEQGLPMTGVQGWSAELELATKQPPWHHMRNAKTPPDQDGLNWITDTKMAVSILHVVMVMRATDVQTGSLRRPP